MKLKELINKKVTVLVCESNPDLDPTAKRYYHGNLKNVPEHLKEYDVLDIGWSFDENCDYIAVQKGSDTK